MDVAVLSFVPSLHLTVVRLLTLTPTDLRSYCFDKQSRPGVDQQIAVLHELNTALTMASGHPSQNRVGGVIQALVPLLSGSNNEVLTVYFEERRFNRGSA